MIRTALAALYVATPAYLLLACAGEPPASSTVTIRDSAGVAIVENTGVIPPGGEAWSLSPEPVVQVGSLEGPEGTQLYGVWGAARLTDGRIAVVNNRAPDLRIFGPGGEHLHTFGRRGEGPGEFNDPLLAGVLPGDTLVVVDRRLRTINLFHPDEGFIQGASAEPDFLGYLLTVGMFSSGSVLIWRITPWDGSTEGFARRPVHYRSLTLDGTLEHDFGEFPGEETVTGTGGPGGNAYSFITRIPFGKRALAALAADKFYFGSQDRYEIQVLDQYGTLQRLIRLPRPSIPVREEHVQAAIEMDLAEAETEDQARRIRDSWKDMPIPDSHPAHSELRIDALGFLWVEDYRLPGDETPRFTIFDPEGRLVGSLSLPSGLQVQEIGPDYLLGLHEDELGVEYLRVYGLTRPGGP